MIGTYRKILFSKSLYILYVSNGNVEIHKRAVKGFSNGLRRSTQMSLKLNACRKIFFTEFRFTGEFKVTEAMKKCYEENGYFVVK